METIKNPFFGRGMNHPALTEMPWTAADATAPVALVERCPRAAPTPLVDAVDLARDRGVAKVWIKDERDRMRMGSFKALGAAYVIACEHAEGRAAGQTYVTASAGNHGLSVAAGAASFGARSRVFIAETVPEAFAERLRSHGAEVVRAGAVYEESMAEAARVAEAEGLVLLSDSSWPGYFERPHRLMEGYLVLMAEAVSQLPQPPTHIFLQAGVGGLAGACAAHARLAWGQAPRIIVVEPDVAPALKASIEAGGPVVAPGPVSAMGRLDCKEPSLIALKSLARDANDFMVISEDEGEAGARRAGALELPSTPSGAAGLAGLIAAPDSLHLDSASRVLLVLSEGPE
ncbi:MAG: pyridoxal-phosphate dependent enzyme [Pseudomonadota bacterium]